MCGIYALSEGTTQRSMLINVLRNGGERTADTQSACIFTTMDGFERLTSDESAAGASSLTDGRNECYIIVFKNAFAYEALEKTIRSVDGDIVGQTAWEEIFREWEANKSENMDRLRKSGLAFLCFGLLIYFQGNLWKERHKDFCAYLMQLDTSGKSFFRMYFGRLFWYGAAAMLFLTVTLIFIL